MKRLTALLLIVALLSVSLSAQAAEKFSAKTAREARTKALEAFDICAMTSEYNDSRQDRIVRWETSIKVYIEGKPTKQDRKTIDTMLLNLALRVPGLPNVTLTDDPGKSNVQIYFVREKQLKDYVPDYISGNWGYFTFNYRNDIIYQAKIGIATDKGDQTARNHLIQEEFIGALGLANDHDLYKDSILYQPWTTTQQPSEVDWLMLNMLYSPLVSPGMEKNEIHRVFNNAWSK